jgi:very-short-patch-repair endonuclease
MRNKRADIPIDIIAERYANGESLAALGLAYGVSGDTIKAHLLRYGVTIRSHSESMKLDGVRGAIAQKAEGRLVWNKGLTRSTDTRVAQYADKLVGRTVSDALREKMSIDRRKHVWYDVCQECGRSKGHSRRSRCSFCAAEYRVKTYPNGMSGKKMKLGQWEHMMRSMRGVQTRPERAVDRAIRNVFSPYQVYEYTGLGGIVVTLASGKRKIPDFVSRQERKIIEVYGRYWHRNDDPNYQIRQYKAVGWDCLVLWEEEAYQNICDAILYFTYPYEFDTHEVSMQQEV